MFNTSDTETLVDLVITSKPEIIKGAIKTTELGISDHELVLACYNVVQNKKAASKNSQSLHLQEI